MSAVTEILEADYVVVGAGAMGMAFTDALVEHSDATVALVDRRHGVGGHWLDAYPFVRLHQASAFYGVASTLLGGGRVQDSGPEVGLHERATAPEICAYYERVLRERLLGSGQVTFHPGCDHLGGGRFRSLVSGRELEVAGSPRVVDARYLAPQVPSRTLPPFGVADGARVVPVNDLVRLAEPPSEYVVVGSGKTATDAVVWLLHHGVDPGAVRWVRPRDPWMLNRAVVQPDPAVITGMSADVLAAAAAATDPDDFFLRLEDAGVMLRIDRSVTPTMAKAPTLATWEVELLRSIEDVVRLGRIRHVEADRVVLDDGDLRTTRNAVVVHCASPGLRYPPLVPIWRPEAITLQPIRAGAPTWAAALAGFVEATVDGDAEKNRLCGPAPYADTPAGWAGMTLLGGRHQATYLADPAIKAWADTVPLNPARVPPGHVDDGGRLALAQDRLAEHAADGTAGLERLAGSTTSG